MITSEVIGKTAAGDAVEAFVLTNANGLRMRVMTYGGIVTHLEVPDREGRLADVCLGCPDLEGYLGEHPYFGALVGRVAGRLTHGKFTIDGVDYTVACNQPPNHLHGGVHALDKKVWTAEVVGDSALKLSYRSPDGEEGYPGTVDISVVYTLTDTDEWVLEYEAVTDKATPLSLTNHAYFNLAGEETGSVADHVVQILADRYVPVDEEFTLSDRIEAVGSNDLREPKRVGDAVKGLFGGHGDNYLMPEGGGVKEVARVRDPGSGRVMVVKTDAPVLQFYTSVNMEGTDVGKNGQVYQPLSGLCFECQGYPAGVNDSPVGSIVLRPGEVYRQETVYAFSCE